MDVLGLDRAHCTIGETEHPFTLEFNNKDVRITTHYNEDNMASSMYSVIHEGGHARYELNIADEVQYTCLSGGVSMGVHESQSGSMRILSVAPGPLFRLFFPSFRSSSPSSCAT